MSGRPKVIITQSTNNLGLQDTIDDAICGMIVSGIAVGGQFALGDVIGPLLSLDDVEAKGITEDYDSTNTCLAWKQCKDFYTDAPKGTKLYLMVVAKTVTMAQMVDSSLAFAPVMCRTATDGTPHTIIVTRVPDGGYTPTYTTQLEDDIHTAITNAKALRATLADEYIYVRFVIEGRNWQGTVASTKDMRAVATSPDAPHIALVIGNDYDYSQALPSGVRRNYASAGLYGGFIASIPVNQSTARVKSGMRSITTPGYSNGAKWNTLTLAQWDTLTDKGYTFLLNFKRVAGFFWNKDYTLGKTTNDLGNIRYGRVLDKASEIAYTTYVQELNDDVLIDEDTGFVAPSVIKSLEGMVETNIKNQMAGEISSVQATIDPAQNLISLDELAIEIAITPRGSLGTIRVKIGLRNPFIS